MRTEPYLRMGSSTILSQVCEEVMKGDDLGWLKSLRILCEASPEGVGLAAPQAGIAKRAVFIYHKRQRGYFMINPVITARSEEVEKGIEGCLSYPGKYVNVIRYVWVEVIYRTPEWSWSTRRVRGMEARIIQHELDHLDGICRVRDA